MIKPGRHVGDIKDTKGPSQFKTLDRWRLKNIQGCVNHDPFSDPSACCDGKSSLYDWARRQPFKGRFFLA